jgi:hypothetical protein
LAAALAASHSAASSAGHKNTLLSAAPAPQAAASETARHGERLSVERARKPGLKHLAQIAGHEGDDRDAVPRHQIVKRSGDRAANQRVHPEFGEPKRPAGRELFGQDRIGFADDFPVLDFDEAEMPGHVEHRRDAIVPNSKSRFHASKLPAIRIVCRKDISIFRAKNERRLRFYVTIDIIVD